MRRCASLRRSPCRAAEASAGRRTRSRPTVTHRMGRARRTARCGKWRETARPLRAYNSTRRGRRGWRSPERPSLGSDAGARPRRRDPGRAQNRSPRGRRRHGARRTAVAAPCLGFGRGGINEAEIHSTDRARPSESARPPLRPGRSVRPGRIIEPTYRTLSDLDLRPEGQRVPHPPSLLSRTRESASRSRGRPHESEHDACDRARGLRGEPLVDGDLVPETKSSDSCEGEFPRSDGITIGTGSDPTAERNVGQRKSWPPLT
jgi:hypothetical protein